MLLVCLAAAASLSAQTPRLGTIDFPASGAPAAQAPFIRGVLLLHSFEYQDAARAFREAQRLDSGFALAYWGEALTYTHPLWNEQDRNAARAALQRLGPTAAARRSTAPTPREQAYLSPLEILYCEGAKAERDAAYSAAMGRLVTQVPGDRAAWTPHHYTEWLGYGYLQQGRYQEALQHLELMHQNMNQARRGRPVLAEMRADYVVNTERWDSPCLQWSIDLTGVRARDAAVDVFVAGLSALKRGDRRGAERGLADLAAVNRSRAPAAPGQERDQVPDILLKELEALLRQADGAPTDAIALMREATALEDAMSVEFGPPADVKPAHELFGEILLQAGRLQEAQREFARALALAPKRALSLLGLGRAAAAAGDRTTAVRAYGELREIWHGANPGLPGLTEAARFIAARP